MAGFCIDHIFYRKCMNLENISTMRECVVGISAHQILGHARIFSNKLLDKTRKSHDKFRSSKLVNDCRLDHGCYLVNRYLNGLVKRVFEKILIKMLVSYSVIIFRHKTDCTKQRNRCFYRSHI